MGDTIGTLTIVLAALVAVGALVALLVALRVRRDPFVVVRLEFARQCRALGLARREVVVDVPGDGTHRVVYVVREARAGAVDPPTLVMVHGYTGSKENWCPVVKRLGRDCRIVLPDLPGWGDSQRIAGADYGFSAQAERLAAFLRAVSPGVPVVLVGHSMGGGITAVVAARHPALVARVALLSAAGVRFADNDFGLAVLEGLNPFGVEDAASLERYLDVLFHDRRARPPLPWPVKRILIHQRRADAAFEQSVLDRIGRGPEQFLPGELAARIQQPTLLLWGAQDRVIDRSAMDLYAACIPQARTLLVEGAGHMTLTEQPGPIAAALRALIDEESTA